MHNGDPYLAVLRAPGDKVSFAFYKDKRKGNEYREQTVTTLTGFKSKAKQQTISLLEKGDELELEEDFNHEGSVIVSYIGDPIGNLPKKTADKFLQDGVYAAFFEKSEEIESSDCEMIEKPSIRIYW